VDSISVFGYESPISRDHRFRPAWAETKREQNGTADPDLGVSQAAILKRHADTFFTLEAATMKSSYFPGPWVTIHGVTAPICCLVCEEVLSPIG
jgi:hypothetical protein